MTIIASVVPPPPTPTHQPPCNATTLIPQYIDRWFSLFYLQGVVLVHDISKPNSFNEVEDWLTDIRQVYIKSLIFLIAAVV